MFLNFGRLAWARVGSRAYRDLEGEAEGRDEFVAAIRRLNYSLLKLYSSKLASARPRDLNQYPLKLLFPLGAFPHSAPCSEPPFAT